MGAGGDARGLTLRELPAVHEVAAGLTAPHAVAVAAARAAIDEARGAALSGRPMSRMALQRRAIEILAALERPSLRRVLNASGVIIHTNLGRAPLPAAAQDAIAAIAAGYSNLELDLETGARGRRQQHVEALLSELTGAEAATVVNNGAGAVLLAACALAGPGRGIVVSRGQLVEIGGGFRIPEVIAASGARLIEVGTTNRTRLSDYERAVTSSPVEVGAILRVHPSNFRTVGFVQDASIEELCSLGVPVIDDVGSGLLGDELGLLAVSGEPPVRRSVAAGAALICCSADKLLGGPQAGLLVGTTAAVAAMTSHPLARALRIDKLSLAALAATLALYRDPARARTEVPVLAMLEAAPAVLAARAQRLRDAIGRGEIVDAVARVGGGTLPLLELTGPAVALDVADPGALARRLRKGEPPVIARIHDGRLLLDPRTLDESEVDAAANAARAALDPR